MSQSVPLPLPLPYCWIVVTNRHRDSNIACFRERCGQTSRKMLFRRNGNLDNNVGQLQWENKEIYASSIMIWPWIMLACHSSISTLRSRTFPIVGLPLWKLLEICTNCGSVGPAPRFVSPSESSGAGPTMVALHCMAFNFGGNIESASHLSYYFVKNLDELDWSF